MGDGCPWRPLQFWVRSTKIRAGTEGGAGGWASLGAREGFMGKWCWNLVHERKGNPGEGEVKGQSGERGWIPRTTWKLCDG